MQCYAQHQGTFYVLYWNTPLKPILNNVYEACIGTFFADFKLLRICTLKFSETFRRPNARRVFYESGYDNIIL